MPACTLLAETATSITLPFLRSIGERAMARGSLSFIEKARELGDFISLEVRQSNAPAIGLYEKLGFWWSEREKISTHPLGRMLLFILSFLIKERKKNVDSRN